MAPAICMAAAIMQGGLALDPRSGSKFGGGMSILSIYRRFIVDFAGPQNLIDSISTIHRRYVDDTEPVCRQLTHSTFWFTQHNTRKHTGAWPQGSFNSCGRLQMNASSKIMLCRQSHNASSSNVGPQSSGFNSLSIELGVTLALLASL